MTISFDSKSFSDRCHEAVWKKRMHFRNAAKEAGVSPSTLCRIASSGKTPDADSLARLLHWLGADFKEFIKITPPPIGEKEEK